MTDEEAGEDEKWTEAQRKFRDVLINSFGDGVSSGRLGRRANQSFWDEDQSDFLRDYRNILGYPDHVDIDDIKGFYTRMPIAGRLVDKPVEDSWKEEPDVFAVDEEGQPADSDEARQFNEAWQQVKEDNDLINRFKRADKLQRLGQFGIMMLGLSDVTGDDGQASPPPSRDRNQAEADSMEPSDLLYVQPYSQAEADIEARVTDSSDPDFGMPEEYEVEIFPEADTEEVSTDHDDDNEGDAIGINVHRGRVVHIVENPGASGVRGRPALLRVFNRLIDIQKVMGPSAESLYQVISPKWWLSAKEGFDWSEVDTDELEKDFEAFVHNISDALNTKGAELERLGGDDVDPTPVAEILFKSISVDQDIPQSILFGNETGERATTEDRRQWLGVQMRQRQTNHNTQNIVRPFINKLQRIGILPDVRYKVEWPSLFEMTEAEKADIAETRAKAVKALAPQQSTESVAPMPVLREEVLQFLPRDVDAAVNSMMPVDDDFSEEFEDIDPVYEQYTSANGGA